MQQDAWASGRCHIEQRRLWRFLYNQIVRYPEFLYDLNGLSIAFIHII